MKWCEKLMVYDGRFHTIVDVFYMCSKFEYISVKKHVLDVIEQHGGYNGKLFINSRIRIE